VLSLDITALFQFRLCFELDEFICFELDEVTL